MQKLTVQKPSFVSIIEGLVEKRFVCVDQFLPQHLFVNLCREVRRDEIEGLTRVAKIGRLSKARVNRKIRGDKIRWIHSSNTPTSIHPFFSIIEDLREELRQNLFLPLHDTEQHFAIYPPGAGYRKHLDCHKNSNDRVVTFILYLNRKNWGSNNGGQLKVWTGKRTTECYQPLGNRLILFSSSEYYHAVLPATKSRYSLTGWFRRKAPLI